jgi:hypothetical protein
MKLAVVLAMTMGFYTVFAVVFLNIQVMKEQHLYYYPRYPRDLREPVPRLS